MNLIFSKILYTCSGLILLLSVFNKETTQRKIIRDGAFDYVVYVSINKTAKTNSSKTYFWYKSGKIRNSTGSAGGDLLHDTFTKYYANKQLAEQGEFHYGLKDKVWKSWYDDGTLEKVIKYDKGIAQGAYYTYDSSGKVKTKGHYSRGKKSGTWITYDTVNDTIQYKKGDVYIKKEKDTLKPPFLKRISKWVQEKTKKKKDSLGVEDETSTTDKKEKKNKKSRKKTVLINSIEKI